MLSIRDLIADMRKPRLELGRLAALDPKSSTREKARTNHSAAPALPIPLPNRSSAGARTFSSGAGVWRNSKLFRWIERLCERRDSNPHALRHWILSPADLTGAAPPYSSVAGTRTDESGRNGTSPATNPATQPLRLAHRPDIVGFLDASALEILLASTRTTQVW